MHEIHTIYWNKIWYILHPNIYAMKYCHGTLKFGWKIIEQVISYGNIVMYNTLIFVQGIILGLHLVLVAPPRQFTISIEQDK